MSQDAHARPSDGAPDPLYDANVPTPTHAERARTLVAQILTGTLCTLVPLRWSLLATCPSRIRCQPATGSWTKSRQWETQRTLFSSARATMWPPAKVDGVWPFNDAWLRTSL